MPTYAQKAGTLSQAFRAGDSYSASIDFSVSLTGFSLASHLLSTVTGQQVVSFTTAPTDLANGVVNIALTAAQTSALPVGTYRWEMIASQSSLVRTYLVGFVEVTA